MRLACLSSSCKSVSHTHTHERALDREMNRCAIFAYDRKYTRIFRTARIRDACVCNMIGSCESFFCVGVVKYDCSLTRMGKHAVVFQTLENNRGDQRSHGVMGVFARQDPMTDISAILLIWQGHFKRIIVLVKAVNPTFKSQTIL